MSILLLSILAVGFGLGFLSCLSFLRLLILGSLNNSFIIIEIVLLVLLIIVFISTIKKHSISNIYSESVPKLKPHLLILIVFFILLISGIIVFVYLSLGTPHGSWDAWAIWNMRARFLFRGGVLWGDTFSNIIHWSHPDYPLLIPGAIARCWRYIGNETTVVPVLIAMLFTFAIVGLLVSSLSILRSKNQGLLAGLVILGTPFFIAHGASQYADIPLGFFFLSTLVLLCLQDEMESSFFWLIMAGAMAGFAAWTKNEGILFLVSVIIAYFIATIISKSFKGYLREVYYFVMGLAPVLVIIIYFKVRIAPPNDLIAGQGLHPTVERLTDLYRYLTVGRAFISQLVRFSNGFIIVLIAYSLFLGMNFDRNKKGIVVSSIVLCLMFVGYFFVYITTPLNLNFHLGNSLNRLFLQLWPSFIFIFFMIVSTPEKVTIRFNDK